MNKTLNCFFIIFLNLFLSESKLNAQQPNSLKKKYCTIIGKISDSSLISQIVQINLMQSGKDDTIDSILIHQDKTKQYRCFEIKFSISDSNNRYALLFKGENDLVFQPFFVSFFLYNEDSLFLDVKKKENKINLLFKDKDNRFVNNAFDSIDSNLIKSLRGDGNHDSLKALFFRDIIKLIDKYPEAGLFTIWQYRRIAFTDSLDYVFMNILYNRVDSLTNMQFNHSIIDVLNSEIRPNKNAIDFLSESLDSTIINTNQYRGNYLLLDFWASWCGPCRKKNQELKNEYNNISHMGLKILSVSIDEHYGLWRKAVNDDQLPWENGWFWDKNEEKRTMDFYRIDTIPLTILLDPQGKVIGINPSLTQIENAIK